MNEFEVRMVESPGRDAVKDFMETKIAKETVNASKNSKESNTVHQEVGEEKPDGDRNIC